MELSPERQLLLACARTKLSNEIRTRLIELASGKLDWDQIAAVSCAQGIAPLIHHSLVKSDATCLVSPAVAQTLKSAYYFNAARNSVLYADLGKVLLALREERIEFVALKGAALAETVYPHRALRTMCDIDLLVRKEKLAEVENKLRDMGYLLDEREYRKEYWQQRHYHFPYVMKSGISIEVHWHIKRPTDPFEINLDSLWERAQRITIEDVEALVFSPEDLLLYLCQHFWKHKLTGGIRPLCDIAEVATYYRHKIDWSKIVRTSFQWEMDSCSYLGLWLARELLDAPIPESFFIEVKPANFHNEVIGWARERVLSHGERQLLFPDLLKLFWEGRSIKERCAVLQNALSRKTVAEYAKDTSASKMAYLYYPLRIKNLLSRYGPIAYRMLVGNTKIRAAAEAAVQTEKTQQQLTKWLSSGY